MPETYSEPSITFFSEDVDFSISNSDLVSQWLFLTADEEDKKIDYLNVIFCSDDYLLNINQQYLKHDFYTDIITFDYSTDLIQGELFISIHRVKENAKERNIDFDIELSRVMIHGLLHICGYSDKSRRESEIMRKKEDYYLQKFSLMP